MEPIKKPRKQGEAPGADRAPDLAGHAPLREEERGRRFVQPSASSIDQNISSGFPLRLIRKVFSQVLCRYYVDGIDDCRDTGSTTPGTGEVERRREPPPRATAASDIPVSRGTCAPLHVAGSGCRGEAASATPWPLAAFAHPCAACRGSRLPGM